MDDTDLAEMDTRTDMVLSLVTARRESRVYRAKQWMRELVARRRAARVRSAA